MRRSVALLTLAGLVPAIAGCQWNYQRPPEPANNPVQTDEAMSLRDWPVQDSYYANSSLIAYRNRSRNNYETTRRQARYAGLFTSPAAFIGQIFVLPVSLIRYPFGTKQRFTTLTYEPTYTAMPSRPEPHESIDRVPVSEPRQQPAPVPVEKRPPLPGPTTTTRPAERVAPLPKTAPAARVPTTAPVLTPAPRPAPATAPVLTPTPSRERSIEPAPSLDGLNK